MECPYEFNSIIGTGGSGTIFRVKSKATQENRIIKAIKPSSYDYPEVSIESSLNSPYLLHLKEIIFPNACPELNKFSYGISMPVASTIFTDILGQERWDYYYEAVYGVAQLHSLNILHLDIKADNVFILNDKAVIADFGLSTYTNNIDELKPYKLIGTDNYLSPLRVSDYLATRISSISYANDVQALGYLLMYNVLGSDSKYFKSATDYGEVSVILKRIQNQFSTVALKRPDGKELLNLFYRMIRQYPISLTEVLSDSFFLSKGFQYEGVNKPEVVYDSITSFPDISSQVAIISTRITPNDIGTSPILSLAFDLCIRTLSRNSQKFDLNYEISLLVQAAIKISQPFFRYLVNESEINNNQNINPYIEIIISSTRGLLYRPTIYNANLEYNPRLSILSSLSLNFEKQEENPLIVYENIIRSIE